MTRYLIRRIFLIVPTLWLILTIVFIIFRMVPGDPVQFVVEYGASMEEIEQVRHEMGLDQPLWIQYIRYMSDAIQGDFGKSKIYRARVVDQLWLRVPATIELALASMLLSVMVGIPAGIIAAMRQNSIFDYASMVLSVAGVCIPSFWLGLMLILLLSVQLDLLPTAGRGTVAQLILPAVTLAAGQTALIARMTRSSMLEVLGEDYIRTARAKGLHESLVIFRHALPNALIPTITVVGLQFGFLLGGSVVVETVFSWPGLGQLMIESVRQRDYPMVQGAVLIFAGLFLIVNLLVDLSYPFINPTVRYE